MNFRRFTFAITLAVIGTVIILLCPLAQAQTIKAGPAHVAWPWWFHDDSESDLFRELLDDFDKKYPAFRGHLDAYPDDYASVGRFSDNKDPFGVLIHPAPDRNGRLALQYRFPPEKTQPERFIFGQRRLVIVASKDLQLRNMSLRGAQWLLRKNDTEWPAVKEENSLRLSVRPICGPEKSWGYRFMHRHFMAYDRQVQEGVIEHTHYEFRVDLQKVNDSKDVLAAVRKQPKSIGFVEYQPDLDFTGVDVLATRNHWDHDWCKPQLQGGFQEDYPFGDTMYLYLHPAAGEAASQFCQFVVGLEGSAIIEKHGFQTPCQQHQLLANARLAQLKSNRGVRLSAIGVADGKMMVPDLAMEYVKAKVVVLANYVASDSDVAAVGAFVRPGGSELLLLSDKPSPRAMEVHGAKWSSLGVGEDGKPDGTGPVEYVLAGRAVAIIVNPANKLESLTFGKIQAIFRGDVDDWAVIGGTELTVPAGRPAAGGAAAGGRAKIPIHSFGLRAGGVDGRSSIAAGVFHSEAVAAGKIKRMVVKKDTAEVVAAVSMDSQAIGFVDLTAIPGMGAGVLAGDVVVGALADDLAAGGQSVRVLAIQLGTGERAKYILPTAENVKNAMYPLSQRLYLYVHPQANETAKDFAKFLATCGGSEASPYADTVKSVMEAYRKHGLIPLAEEAMVRAAKDAMAEVEAREVKARAAGK